MTILVSSCQSEQLTVYLQERLESFGVSSASPVEAEISKPADLVDRLWQAYSAEIAKKPGDPKVEVGSAWQYPAAELVIRNSVHQAWGWCDPRNVHFLDFWRQFDPRARFLLVYISPTQHIAASLSANKEHIDLDYLLQEWALYHEALISFFREFPDRCILVSVDCFASSPIEVSRRLQREFGIETRRVNGPGELPLSALWHLIAMQYDLTDRPENDLWAELEASASIVSPGDAVASERRVRAASSEYWEMASKGTDLERLTAANESLSQRIAELHDDQGRASSMMNDFRARIEELTGQLQQEAKETERLKTSVSEKNELLQLQLEQAREELSYYFSRYRELHSKSENATMAPQVELEHNATESVALKTDLVVDLRHPIRGKGWHNAEDHGRWAGSDLVSTLEFPVLEPADYDIEITIVDAMSLAIVKGLEFRFDEQILGAPKAQILSHMRGLLAPVRRMRAAARNMPKPFPIKLRLRLNPSQFKGGKQSHTLSIISSAAISPSALGEADSRQLSICVESVNVLKRSL